MNAITESDSDIAELVPVFPLDKRGEKSFAFVPTQGGRYDVDLKGRMLVAVYWDEEPFPVRRATWFWKVTGDAWMPYEETIAEKLEVGLPKLQYFKFQYFNKFLYRVNTN